MTPVQKKVEAAEGKQTTDEDKASGWDRREKGGAGVFHCGRMIRGPSHLLAC